MRRKFGFVYNCMCQGKSFAESGIFYSGRRLIKRIYSSVGVGYFAVAVGKKGNESV